MIGSSVNKLDKEHKSPCDCDVSDEIIDFSLKNHMSDAFYGFFKNSFKNQCRNVARGICSIIVGLAVGMLLFFFLGIAFIKFHGVQNERLTKFSKLYATKLFKDEKISVKSSKLAFDKLSPVLILNGLDLNGLCLNEVRIVPSLIKSIFTKTIHIDKVELENANLEFAVSNKTDNLFIKNYFAKPDDNRKYIPIHQVDANFSKVLKGAKYSLKNSNVILRRGRDVFNFTDVSTVLNTDRASFGDMSFVFKIDKTVDKIKFNISDVAGIKHALVSFNNLNSEAIKSYIHEKQIGALGQVACLLKHVKSNIDGNISCVIDGLVLKAGRFKMSSKGGVLGPINSLKALQVDRIDVSGTFDTKSITIDKVDIKRKNTAVKISGIKMCGNDIAKMDGTIELRNVSKTDLAMLPDKLTSACMILFENSLPNFQLTSLKMDVNAFPEHDRSIRYNISHGMFEVKGATFPLADKVIHDVHASGEIYNDSIRMNIKSAEIGKMKIYGGSLTLYNTGNRWSGEINTKLSKAEFFNQMNILKKCKIPFDTFALHNNVDCTLKIASNNDTSNNGFDILGGHGELRSGNKVASIKWDKENVRVTGSAETKDGNAVDLNINMNLKSDSGNKIITIDSDDNVIHSIAGIGDYVLHGRYKLTFAEKWNGAIGSYSVTGDLNGAVLTLPAFGIVKRANDSGSISAVASVNGDIMKFDSLNIKTAKHNITGKLVINKSKGEVVSCDLKDCCDISSSSISSVRMHKTDGNNVELFVTGKYLDVANLLGMLKNISNDREVILSVNVNQAKVTNVTSVRDLKGRITIKNGNIISGALYCVLLDGSTVVIDASKIDDNSVLNVNVSNAGQFLKEFDITSSVVGGKIKMTMASEINPSRDIRAINCEMSDIIVKDNEQLGKIVSLSTANNVDSKNFAVGFNGVVCSITMMDGVIIVNDGRAIGPMICMSFSGSYKPDSDELKICGIAVPVNMSNIGRTVYSPYNMSGSLASPDVAVNPIAYTDRNILSELFGIGVNDNLPIIGNSEFSKKHGINISSAEEIKPIEHNVEEAHIKTPIDLEKLKRNKVKRTRNVSPNKNVVRDKEFGITVTRGV